MKILVDTDVLVDVALERAPHVEDSALILRWAARERSAAVAWHSLPNCAYLLRDAARPFLIRLLGFMTVAPVSTADAKRALALPMQDIEDALQAAAALAWGAEFIVTRNVRDYRSSPVPALTPTEFLRRWN